MTTTKTTTATQEMAMTAQTITVRIHVRDDSETTRALRDARKAAHAARCTEQLLRDRDAMIARSLARSLRDEE